MAQTASVFIGIHGCVLALDRATGQEIWRTKLKGEFVNVVLDGNDLFAATAGEIYSLDTATGQVRWQNPLKGLGLGMVTIAAPGGGQSIPMRKQQEDDEAAAGATTAIG